MQSVSINDDKNVVGKPSVCYFKANVQLLLRREAQEEELLSQGSKAWNAFEK